MREKTLPKSLLKSTLSMRQQTLKNVFPPPIQLVRRCWILSYLLWMGQDRANLDLTNKDPPRTSSSGIKIGKSGEDLQGEVLLWAWLLQAARLTVLGQQLCGDVLVMWPLQIFRNFLNLTMSRNAVHCASPRFSQSLLQEWATLNGIGWLICQHMWKIFRWRLAGILYLLLLEILSNPYCWKLNFRLYSLSLFSFPCLSDLLFEQLYVNYICEPCSEQISHPRSLEKSSTFLPKSVKSLSEEKRNRIMCEIFLGGAETMDKNKRTMKDILCSTPDLATSSGETISKLNHISSSGKTNPKQTQSSQTTNNPCNKPSGSPHVANLPKENSKPAMVSDNTPKPISTNSDSSIQLPSRPSIDMKLYLSKLQGVRTNILKLKETSLLGYVLGDPIEFSKLRNKIKNDWTFFQGSFEILEKPNLWFELKFANPIDQQRAWDGRPYHIFGKLILLKPWSSNFDPFHEPISTVDMWVRIPQLPVEYISFDVLSTIIEMNKLGTLIKLDPYTEKKQRVSYARLCINVDVNTLHHNTIIIPDEEGEAKVYNLWLEESPEGCGNCGAREHTFTQCPLRNAKHQSIQLTFQKLKVSSDLEDTSSEKSDPAEKWQEVVNNKKKSIPKTKERLSPSESLKKTNGGQVNPNSKMKGSIPVVIELPNSLTPPSVIQHPNDEVFEECLVAPIPSVHVLDNEEFPILTEHELNELLEDDDLLVDASDVDVSHIITPPAPVCASLPEEYTDNPVDAAVTITQVTKDQISQPAIQVGLQNESLPSDSESAKRKDMEVEEDTASSNLKGAKKMKF